MWITILVSVIIATGIGLIFLFTRFQHFGIVRRIAGERKWLRRLLGLIPILVFIGFCFLDAINTIIVLLHVMIFWALAELGAFLWRRFVRHVRRNVKEDVPRNTEESCEASEQGAEGSNAAERRSEEERAAKDTYRPYWLGIGVLVFSAVYLCIGWYLAHHVWVTKYDLTTDKDLGQKPLTVVLFADSHVGTTFDGEGFAEQMKRIEAENPDVVVIAGDFVDDSTTKEDMLRSVQALGEMKTTYGVYYSFGNHDKGYFRSRRFSFDEMTAEMEKYGIHVLLDEAELVADSFYIIGRRDKSVKERLSMEELVKPLDVSKYMIVLDHQPNDYAAEAAAGVDLVLSGHTHGGQLIPINRIGELIGANDRTYGLEERDGTTFIVTSGISDWAIGFKTGTKSEYVVINIAGVDKRED